MSDKQKSASSGKTGTQTFSETIRKGGVGHNPPPSSPPPAKPESGVSKPNK